MFEGDVASKKQNRLVPEGGLPSNNQPPLAFQNDHASAPSFFDTTISALHVTRIISLSTLTKGAQKVRQKRCDRIICFYVIQPEMASSHKKNKN